MGFAIQKPSAYRQAHVLRNLYVISLQVVHPSLQGFIAMCTTGVTTMSDGAQTRRILLTFRQAPEQLLPIDLNDRTERRDLSLHNFVVVCTTLSSCTTCSVSLSAPSLFLSLSLSLSPSSLLADR